MLVVRAQGSCHSNLLLPRASTCTYTLFLPPYQSKEELDHKLTSAIELGAGFYIQ